jgi:hypothetical protein
MTHEVQHSIDHLPNMRAVSDKLLLLLALLWIIDG